MKRRAAALTFLAFKAAFFVGGCELVAMGVATPMIVQQNRVNLANSSYATVDILVHQAGKALSRTEALAVSPLEELIDLNRPGAIPSPELGEVITQQMKDRFVQLGYNVQSSGVIKAELRGTYRLVHNKVEFHVRLIDRKSGRIMGTTDYTLPLVYDLRRYTSGGQTMLPPLFNNLNK